MRSGISGPKGDLFIPEDDKTIHVTVISLSEVIRLEVNEETAVVSVVKREEI